MDTNQINGVKVLIIGIILAFLLILMNPRDQILASAAIGTMFAFGGMLVSGHWPYTPKRPRRRRIGQSRINYWLQPIKDLVIPRRNMR